MLTSESAIYSLKNNHHILFAYKKSYKCYNKIISSNWTFTKFLIGATPSPTIFFSKARSKSLNLKRKSNPRECLRFLLSHTLSSFLPFFPLFITTKPQARNYRGILSSPNSYKQTLTHITIYSHEYMQIRVIARDRRCWPGRDLLLTHSLIPPFTHLYSNSLETIAGILFSFLFVFDQHDVA